MRIRLHSPPALILSISSMMMLLGACSTVNRGITDHFFVDTVPQGASVQLLANGINPKRHACAATPCAIPVSRNAEFVARIEKPGFEPVEIFVGNSRKRSTLAGSVAGNSAVGTGIVVGSAAYAGYLAGTVFSVGGGTGGAVGTAAGAAAGLAAGVVGAMVLTDLATGATRNLTPNPVILALSTAGEPTITDPRVDKFRKLDDLRMAVRKACPHTRQPRPAKPCNRAQDAYQDAKRDFAKLSPLLITEASETD